MTVWHWLLIGYVLTVLIETPVLMVGLSDRHPMRRRVVAGLWLTACTYPVVILVLPQWIDVAEQRVLYLLVAETFAPVVECGVFWLGFGERELWGKGSMWRDFTAIVLANLVSFATGEMLIQTGVVDRLLG